MSENPTRLDIRADKQEAPIRSLRILSLDGMLGSHNTAETRAAAYDRLNIPVARANIVQPPSGETKVTIVESVRDYDVYILNTVSREHSA